MTTYKVAGRTKGGAAVGAGVELVAGVPDLVQQHQPRDAAAQLPTRRVQLLQLAPRLHIRGRGTSSTLIIDS